MTNRPPVTLAEAGEFFKLEQAPVSESHLLELVYLANSIAERHGECPRDLMQEWAADEAERQGVHHEFA